MSEDINFSKLQKEFVAAKAADEKYSRENDAKFRAVHQKVGSYEEFRDIVAASHLQPLDKKDILGTDKIQQPWNSLCSSNKSADQILGSNVSQTSVDVIDSCDKFTKAWKRQNEDQGKIQLLFSIDENLLDEIFRCDIPGTVLEDSIQLLGDVLSQENCLKICDILRAFTHSKRFTLSLKFLAKTDKQRLEDLLIKLEKVGCDIEELKANYMS